MRKIFLLVFNTIMWLMIFIPLSCTEEQVDQGSPSVTFSSTDYKVKVSEEVKLVAVVSNAVNPVFSWKLDGEIVSTDSIYVFSSQQLGEYYITFRLDADNGSLEEQVKVTVKDKISPEIMVSESLIAYQGTDLLISPTVLYDDNATYIWKVDGVTVSDGTSLTFNSTMLGSHTVSFKVSTEDGMDLVNITVNVLPVPTAALFFDDGHYRLSSDNSTRRFSVPMGKSIVLAPVICNMSISTTFEWSVNGSVQISANEYLTFTPEIKGTYAVKVTGTNGSSVAEANLTVECTDAEGTYYRAATSSSKAKATDAFEFIPAPGQFVNYQTGSTAEDARIVIANSLATTSTSWMASLGAYGGYYIVGFDHSVDNSDGDDLIINGNAFSSWSEPGIVWVMQDENGNGKPDDMWYELKGSETGKAETKQRYAITYYKPSEGRENVLWTDNLGRTGSVDLNTYHMQESYFPMFIEGESYILCGTCLASTMTIGTLETCPGYAWGYVDNYGDGTASTNAYFDIADAIQADGTAATLRYIDFVKVHTAMTGKGEAVGEISCEAGAPFDKHLQ